VPDPGWKPTHVVNGRGLPAWDEPDPSKPVATQLTPWLELQVIGEVGDWAHVMAVTGWTGWVDSRQLIRRAG